MQTIQRLERKQSIKFIRLVSSWRRKLRKHGQSVRNGEAVSFFFLQIKFLATCCKHYAWTFTNIRSRTYWRPPKIFLLPLTSREWLSCPGFVLYWEYFSNLWLARTGWPIKRLLSALLTREPLLDKDITASCANSPDSWRKRSLSALQNSSFNCFWDVMQCLSAFEFCRKICYCWFAGRHLLSSPRFFEVEKSSMEQVEY